MLYSASSLAEIGFLKYQRKLHKLPQKLQVGRFRRVSTFVFCAAKSVTLSAGFG